MYYEMAEALLSTQMREVWLTYLKVKPKHNTWAGMDSYMGIHYAALDKTVDAEKKFEETKLQVGTEKAWQAYVNAQTEQIADMDLHEEQGSWAREGSSCGARNWHGRQGLSWHMEGKQKIS